MTQENIKNKWLNGIQLEGLYTFNKAVKAVENIDGQIIPNNDDWDELIENTEFYFDKESKEGVFTFQDKTELRLPAEGYRYGSDGDSTNQNTNGNYWSSSMTLDSARASYVYFSNKGQLGKDTSNRVYGCSVRCVKDIKS